MININLGSFCPQCTNLMVTIYTNKDLKVERCTHCNIGKRTNINTGKIEYIVPPEYEPTSSQMNLIISICSSLMIDFDGVTKAQATEFISSNIDKYLTHLYGTNLDSYTI